MQALVISHDSKLHAEIATHAAARVPPLQLVATRASMREALVRTLANHPEILIIDGSNAVAADVDLFERLTQVYPQAQVMLLGAQFQPELLKCAMRIGVREVLPLPLAPGAFNEALDRISTSPGMMPIRDGKVIAFVSCKGGSGATFVSSNFGHALASLAEQKVLLIDLHEQFGDAALSVSDQKPSMSLPDVCSHIERLDGPFLHSCLIHVTPGFGVLPAAEDPAQFSNAKPEHIEAILRVARQYYDYVLLDVGRQINAVSLRALDSADKIYPVMQLALPDIRGARRLLDIFRSLGYPAENIGLVVNRFEKGGALHLEDAKSTLGVEVLHTIPNDYVAVSDSVNQGVPVLELSRNSPVARGLAELVELVTSRRVTENKKLFGRLFGRGNSYYE